MGPIIDKQKEYDENVPKILSQMDHHMGTSTILSYLFDLYLSNQTKILI